ncbi:Uncharacterised protein [Mycobacteroides abscessus]|nr:Uncharacterised protein [Mycobacteroides abscessus]
MLREATSRVTHAHEVPQHRCQLLERERRRTSHDVLQLCEDREPPLLLAEELPVGLGRTCHIPVKIDVDHRGQEDPEAGGVRRTEVSDGVPRLVCLCPPGRGDDPRSLRRTATHGASGRVEPGGDGISLSR